MIIRLIVVDPNPKPGESDILVFQVPEKSREYHFLTTLLDTNGMQWVVVESNRRKPKTLKN